MIDLAPTHLQTVRRILAEHVPQCEVRAFGSRVTGTAKDYSDLDLALIGPGPLSMDTMRRIREAFEECDLPIRVDVLDWHSISPGFRKVIEAGFEVLQGPGSPGPMD
jgi:uncharacterized protein